MKILIIGNTGYLGSYLLSNLALDGHYIWTANSKTHNLKFDDGQGKLEETVPYRQIDYIFHCATYVQAGNWCQTHHADAWMANQFINTHVIDYWKSSQPQAKLIAFGSSCSYSPGSVMTEDNYLNGNVDEDLYAYAYTKRILYIGLKAYAQQYGLKYLYFVPSTLYGPLFTEHDTHFIYDIIRKIYTAKVTGSEPIFWGTGQQKRELIYIDDAVKLILNNLDRENEIINLSTGKEFTITEYTAMVAGIMDYRGRVYFDNTAWEGVSSKNLLQTKIQMDFTPLEEGLRKTIDWYCWRQGNPIEGS